MIRTIGHDEGLDTLWSELVYTLARLRAKALTRDLATNVEALLARVAKAMAGQREVWRAEIEAQAQVDEADDDLDDLVDGVDKELRRALDEDRADPRYKRYFGVAPNEVIRLALGSELEKVRGWPKSLAGEPEKPLEALSKPLATAVTAGDAALEGRTEAAAARADQRVREIYALVDDVNAFRESLFGILIGRGVANKLPKTWAARFFRKSAHAAAAPAQPPQQQSAA